MRSGEIFFKWAFETRAKNVMSLYNGENISKERIFLNFTSHNPALITYGPAGLNASIKGIGFVPKREYMDEILHKYLGHINSYKLGDDTYRERGLKLLVKEVYSPELWHRIDYSILATLELAKKHTWQNIQINKEATFLFYQPPAISYELRGRIEIDDVGIFKKFVNAQHDVYHNPNLERWNDRPALIFHIKEIYDNSATKEGFGTQMKYPY